MEVKLGVVLQGVLKDKKGTIQSCFACHCKNGKRFCAKVKNSDLEKIKEYGCVEK